MCPVELLLLFPSPREQIGEGAGGEVTEQALFLLLELGSPLFQPVALSGQFFGRLAYLIQLFEKILKPPQFFVSPGFGFNQLLLRIDALFQVGQFLGRKKFDGPHSILCALNALFLFAVAFVGGHADAGVDLCPGDAFE